MLNRVWAACFVLAFLFATFAPVASAARGRIALVVSNVTEITGTPHRTGVWAEELLVPLRAFTDAGYDVDLASPTGGAFAFDPRSYSPAAVPDAALRHAAQRFRLFERARMLRTLRLADLRPGSYAALFVAGGHGVMFDVARDPALARLTAQMLASGKVVAAVCHGPCFLATARGSDGRPLIEGRRVTGFSNAEEEGARMTRLMPFSLEDELRRASGGRFEAGPPWAPHVVADGRLITGQNPASSEAVARKTLEALEQR